MPTELTFRGYAPAVTLSRTARTITGRITVFGVVAASHGLLLEPGCLQPRQPLTRVKLLRDHNHADPVGYMTEINDDGTEATFHVPEGDNGDRALTEAADHLRDGLSVGFRSREYTWDDDGVLHVHQAELYEVSLCAIPAFEDAQVINVAASQARPLKGTLMNREQLAAALAAGTITQAEHDTQLAALTPAPPATPATPAEPVAPELAAQRPAPAPDAPPRAQARPRMVGLAETTRAVAAAVGGGAAGAVRRALAAVVPVDVAGVALLRADRRGPLGAADRTDRPIIEALGTPSPLQTGTKIKGWQWDVKPTVDTYAGNKGDIHSNKPKTKPVETDVHRSAGGWDIDRIFLDLGEAGFLGAFWEAAVADYKRDCEEYAAEKVLDGATVRPTAPTLLAALGQLGADFATIGARLDAIFIAPDLFEDFAALTQAQVPFWLANATGVSLRNQTATIADLSIRTHPDLDSGQVLGFDSRAATYYEKTPPIRVNAIDLPRGGIDLGLFGYNGLLINDARAITLREVA